MSGGFWWRLVLGWVLAAVVVLVAYNAGGAEGPCSRETPFVRSVDPAITTFRVEHETWPPSQRCIAVAGNGRVVASETYPRPLEWGLAALAFAVPFLTAWAYRRMRPALDQGAR